VTPASLQPQTPITTPPPIPQVSSNGPQRGQTGSSGQSAVFSGQLSVFALPDLLEFLRSGRRTGLLVCSSAVGMGALRFRDGYITGGASPTTPSIGQLLLRSRKISAQALRGVANRQSQGQDKGQADHVLGELLVQEGLVAAVAVQEALTQQIELALRELIQWEDGQFAFDREAVDPPQTSIQVEVDPQGALLNLYKELDETSRTDVPDGSSGG